MRVSQPEVHALFTNDTILLQFMNELQWPVFSVFGSKHEKNGVFWDVTTCGSCKNRRFGGVDSYCCYSYLAESLHSQGDGDTFLRNVGSNMNQSVLYPRRRHSPNSRTSKHEMPWKMPSSGKLTPYGSCTNRRFGGTQRLRHQGDKNRWTRNSVSLFRRSVRRLLAMANVLPSSPILVTLMMVALRSSETSVLTRPTRRNIPGDGIFHSQK
jgi:hypothetical protein